MLPNNLFPSKGGEDGNKNMLSCIQRGKQDWIRGTTRTGEFGILTPEKSPDREY